MRHGCPIRLREQPYWGALSNFNQLSLTICPKYRAHIKNTIEKKTSMVCMEFGGCWLTSGGLIFGALHYGWQVRRVSSGEKNLSIRQLNSGCCGHIFTFCFFACFRGSEAPARARNFFFSAVRSSVVNKRWGYPLALTIP